MISVKMNGMTVYMFWKWTWKLQSTVICRGQMQNERYFS